MKRDINRYPAMQLETRLRAAGKPDAVVNSLGGGWFSLRYGITPPGKFRLAQLRDLVEQHEQTHIDVCAARMKEAEAYICNDCGDRGYGGWNCQGCGGHNIERANP